MEEKMLFLLLFLGTLGTVGTNAQVRIGGNGQPNTAAVLDLNATDAINNGTKGLALPRVSLTDINTALTGSPTVNGMMVYNTNASVTGGSGVGIYYWVTNKWVKMLGSDFVEVDGIIGNEVAGAIAGGGLRRYGDGIAESPYTLGIDTAGAKAGYVMRYLGGAWIPSYPRHTNLWSDMLWCVVPTSGSCYTAIKTPACAGGPVFALGWGPDYVESESPFALAWGNYGDSIRARFTSTDFRGQFTARLFVACYTD